MTRCEMLENDLEKAYGQIEALENLYRDAVKRNVEFNSKNSLLTKENKFLKASLADILLKTYRRD